MTEADLRRVVLGVLTEDVLPVMQHLHQLTLALQHTHSQMTTALGVQQAALNALHLRLSALESRHVGGMLH